MYRFLFWHMCWFLIYSFQKLPDCFPTWQHYYTFPLAMYEDCNISTYSLTVLLCNCLILASLVCIKWCLMALICISLMINDIEHIFICLLHICVSFLEKFLFTSFVHFLIGLIIFFYLLSCKCSLYILDTSPLSDIWCASIFSHFVSWLFTSWKFFTKNYNFDELINFCFLIVANAFDVIYKNSLQNYGCEDLFHLSL